MKANHVGPIGGLSVICVEPGTEVEADDGTRAVVDDRHTVVNGKGAIYVTPRIWSALKEQTKIESATDRENISPWRWAFKPTKSK